MTTAALVILGAVAVAYLAAYKAPGWILKKVSKPVSRAEAVTDILNNGVDHE